MAEKPPLDRIAEKAEPGLADHLEQAFTWLRDQADALLGGDTSPAGIEQALPLDEFGDKVEHASDRLIEVFDQGGRQASNDRALLAAEPGRKIAFRFDLLNPKTVEHAQAYRYDLVRQVTDDTKAAIRDQVQAGVTAGKAPADIGRAIRDSIGLTTAQAGHVQNYRSELEALRPGALARELRDRRFDGAVRRAIDSGNAMSDAMVDKLVGRYQDRYIARRALTISRTETLRAANEGAQAALRQADVRGDFGNGTLRRFWQTAEGCCDVCAAIEDQNPDGVGIDEPFTFDLGKESGSIMVPPKHPNCRCNVTTDFVPGGGDDAEQTDAGEQADDEGSQL